MTGDPGLRHWHVRVTVAGRSVTPLNYQTGSERCDLG